MGTDFTFELGAFFAVVVVNKPVGCMTMGTADSFGDTVFLISIMDGF